MKSLICFFLATILVVSSAKTDVFRFKRRVPHISVPGGSKSPNIFENVQQAAAVAQLPNPNAVRFPNLVNQLQNPPLDQRNIINNAQGPQELPTLEIPTEERFRNVLQLLQNNQPLIDQSRINAGLSQAAGPQVPTITNPTQDQFRNLLRQLDNQNSRGDGPSQEGQLPTIPNPTLEEFRRLLQQTETSNLGQQEGINANREGQSLANPVSIEEQYYRFLQILNSPSPPRVDGIATVPGEAVHAQAPIPNELRYPNLVQQLQAPTLNQQGGNINLQNQQS